ncbi:pentatricopeptide repeat-containing protein [Dorcoceras hygrometricum]|uniref:Pentatricopeptide repeat-containing protein n=1 Tax=Dorcoceras hygrometricum TaxID=472368 RepID=A0A2Z7AS84_9LAMI|nr:pentatricopeptide repeat-containing protein [Dorcoceras hygrometricum]
MKNSFSRVRRIGPFYDFLRSSVGNQSLATKVTPFEVNPDEILSQTLAAIEDPSVSKEETCFRFIKALCVAGNHSDAVRLIQSLHSKNITFSLHTYSYLLQSAGEMENVHLLSEIFKDLVVSCGKLELTSYLILAGALAKHNDSTLLLKFVEEISEMELVRKDIVLNRLIFALGKCGHVEKARLVFSHMKNLDCKPDLVTYNTILTFLGRLGRVDEMLEEFNFMKTVPVLPDVVTYNTMLNSLRKMGRLDLCLAYFKEMSERGLPPDEYSFKALIEVLGRSGNIQDALKVFDDMKCRGINQSIHIYRALIFSLKKMGMIRLALEFSKEMNELPREFPRDFSHKNR